MAAPRALAVPLLASLLLAAVPATVAQSATSSSAPGIHNPDAPSPVTLYMHLLNLQDFPINTQKPDDKWTASQAWGPTTSTTSCLPKDTPGAHVSQEYHTFYGYSSPSYVEYNIQVGGEPRVHPERGISYDALLDQGTPFTLYWYVTTMSAGSGTTLPADPDSAPAPVPHVVVAANLRAGDAISVNDHLYNTGPLLVHGQTTPVTLDAGHVVGDDASVDKDPMVKALGQTKDGKWLYEFAVPMTIDTPVIPRSSGYNLRVDLYMDNPACKDPTGDTPASGALMPNTVRIHSDPEHRPRMQFAVTDPLRIEALHPQFVGDDLVLHVALNAVWGNYDVGEVNAYTPDVSADFLQLKVDGPSPARSLALYTAVQPTNPHFHHQDTMTLVYVWPYRQDHAQPGAYTVHFEAKNDQGTATATADSQFEVGRNTALNCTLGAECHTESRGIDHATHKSPTVGLPSLLGVLAAGLAAVAVRRGRRT
jgi:hypothetical protein